MFARNLETYQPQQEQQQTKVQVKVQKKQWISKGEKFLYSLFVGSVVAASVFIVSYSSSLDSVNRDVQELQTKIEEQTLVNNTLQAEVKQLSEPSRILEVAKKNGLNIQNSKVEQANLVR
ncbi:cell division protein FtsL [Salinibacillus xinjiangensis]|uniref:Cell division protein FtsL n=1 Tax=Salinibacillus xinjiangensis TaxID=1229268 RepID=A0A6G1X3K2_9BACI|nr:cell division protein FtsL [Salinibacillus xinjiangensis]MRG85499.1 cell division protein FtsL [Salinibacillus xinjiangensis]